MNRESWSSASFSGQWGQIKALTWANLKSRYRKTFAGFLWVVLNPLLMYAVQSQIFSRFLKIPIPNYYLFLASGLLPWIFISQSMEMGTPLFISYSSLLRAFPANPMVYLAAQLCDNFINFMAAFLLLLVPLCFYYKTPVGGLLLLPIPMVLLCVGMTGITWILATVQVFFRDTRFLVSFLLSLSYFLTPVFYPLEMVPENLRWMVNVNPFYVLISPFRICIYNFEFHEFLNRIVPAFVAATFFFGLAVVIWRWKRNEVYFYL